MNSKVILKLSNNFLKICNEKIDSEKVIDSLYEIVEDCKLQIENFMEEGDENAYYYQFLSEIDFLIKKLFNFLERFRLSSGIFSEKLNSIMVFLNDIEENLQN